ncbi:MAG TPA: SemiSWEET family transporter [Polyangiaceae bacterium]
MKDVVGWTASILVVVTLVAQIVKQWKSDTSRGVSPWLFVGEIASAVLFLWYAIMIHNAVYITTNILMAIASCVGLGIVAWHRHRAR